VAIIRTNQNVVTQINVFEVDPKNQDMPAELLVEAVQSVCNTPGGISASVHKSLDGTRVTNYAQAADYASWEAVVAETSEGWIFREISENFQAQSLPLPMRIQPEL